MIRAFFASKKWFIWAYGGGIFILASLYGQVYVAVLVNEWYRSFFDMLQRPGEHTMDDFWKSVMYWALITGPFWILAAVTNYVMRLYTLSWREAITFNYLPRWKNVTEDIEGASQRIQEDTFRFTRILESLPIALVPFDWPPKIRAITNRREWGCVSEAHPLVARPSARAGVTALTSTASGTHDVRRVRIASPSSEAMAI